MSGLDTAQSDTLNVTSAGTVTGNYLTQYQVSFTQTGINSDAGPNNILTLNGANYNCSSLPTNVWVDSGSAFSWLYPVAGSSGEQFVYTGHLGLTSPITGSGTASAAYETQYLVTFAVVGGGINQSNWL